MRQVSSFQRNELANYPQKSAWLIWQIWQKRDLVQPKSNL